MRQNASGGPVRPSLPNGPTSNSLPSPNPSLRPHLGPHRPLCPPQLLANGPMGPGTQGPSDSLPVGDNSKSSNSSSNNQPGPSDTGPNGDVPYLQPAGSGDPTLLPHTCTSTQTQDAAPHQALHLNTSQVRHATASSGSDANCARKKDLKIETEQRVESTTRTLKSSGLNLPNYCQYVCNFINGMLPQLDVLLPI